MPLFSRGQLGRKDSRSPSPSSGGGGGGEEVLRNHRSTRNNISNEREEKKASTFGQVISRVAAKARGSTTDTTVPTQQASLLPTTTTTAEQLQPSPHHHRHSPQHRQRNTASSSNTCNNFLLGGNYYPGKDKKRRRSLQQRTTTAARILIIIGALLFVWYVLLPTVSLIWYYGNFLAGRGARTGGGADNNYNWLLLREQSLQLPSLKQERATALAMQLERNHLNRNSNEGQELKHKRRIQILQEIAPDWFHRNNPQAVIVPKQQQDDGTVGETDEVVQQETGDGESTMHTGDETAQHDATPMEEEGGVVVPRRQLRTLQNMDLVTNETSSCPADLDENDIRTTLVIQASLNRVWVLGETCLRWTDPIVAVIVLTDAESHSDETATSLAGWKDKCPQLELIRHKMEHERPEMYPVNHLRNIGLDAVKTSHVLIVDVDFVPSLHLDNMIRSTLQERIGLRRHRPDLWPEEKEAMVVPAFERLLETPCTSAADCMRHLRSNSSFIPHTFPALKDCVKDKDCIVFQSNVNWEGHHSTRSDTWLAGEWYDDQLAAQTAGNVTLQSIKNVQCFDSFRYEPYVVLRWCPSAQSQSTARVAPYYDERFHGYGKNKIQHIAHLRFLGYHFSILPQGFIVHNPHLESQAKETWNNVKGSDLHAAMDELYPKFLKELVVKYLETATYIVDLCSRNND